MRILLVPVVVVALLLVGTGWANGWFTRFSPDAPPSLTVIENGKPIGIVSSRNAMDPDLEEFVSEAQRRKHIREML